VTGKIPSGKRALTVDLEGTPSILAAIRKASDCVLVGFKLESGIPAAELVRRSKARIKERGLDFIVANDLAKVQGDRTSIVVVDKKGRTKAYAGPKALAADMIWEAVLHGLGK
jgi:phosphopantothenoylcysteine synthetase/decarboxylase